jgi:hypothetical protein
MGNSMAKQVIKHVALASLALTLSACAPAEDAKGRKLQTMTCAGTHEISFYDQREFDKKCIAYIESTRDNSPIEE